jgi:hypothetical protein
VMACGGGDAGGNERWLPFPSPFVPAQIIVPLQLDAGRSPIHVPTLFHVRVRVLAHFVSRENDRHVAGGCDWTFWYQAVNALDF